MKHAMKCVITYYSILYGLHIALYVLIDIDYLYNTNENIIIATTYALIGLHNVPSTELEAHCTPRQHLCGVHITQLQLLPCLGNCSAMFPFLYTLAPKEQSHMYQCVIVQIQYTMEYNTYALMHHTATEWLHTVPKIVAALNTLSGTHLCYILFNALWFIKSKCQH